MQKTTGFYWGSGIDYLVCGSCEIHIPYKTFRDMKNKRICPNCKVGAEQAQSDYKTRAEQVPAQEED